MAASGEGRTVPVYGLEVITAAGDVPVSGDDLRPVKASPYTEKLAVEARVDFSREKTSLEAAQQPLGPEFKHVILLVGVQAQLGKRNVLEIASCSSQEHPVPEGLIDFQKEEMDFGFAAGIKNPRS